MRELSCQVEWLIFAIQRKFFEKDIASIGRHWQRVNGSLVYPEFIEGVETPLGAEDLIIKKIVYIDGGGLLSLPQAQLN